MNNKIKMGIVGYGNLGKGALKAIKETSDLELVAVFTRRNPENLDIQEPGVQVVHTDDAENYQSSIDVMLLCGGSATDLPEQVPHFASMFNTVNSFDTHAKMPEFYQMVNDVASKHETTAVIAVGWDPGLFSMNRVIADAIIPNGNNYSFWGEGLSQGHSDAVRQVKGVKNGVQYTIPSNEAIEQVHKGENPELSKADKHRRECYIVAEEGADKEAIEHEIKTMPNYFADYQTDVHFISEETLKRDHAKAPHGGFVIRSGQTGETNQHIYEFSLQLDSNPEFTASVLVAYGRASYKMSQEKQFGAKTVYDIAPGYLSPRSADELRRDFL